MVEPFSANEALAALKEIAGSLALLPRINGSLIYQLRVESLTVPEEVYLNAIRVAVPVRVDKSIEASTELLEL